MDKMKVISHILLLFDIKHMLFSKRSAKQFRQIGQNCKGKHRERSHNVSFTLFFFPSVSFSDTFLLIPYLNFLWRYSETKQVRHGQDCVMVFDGTTTEPTQTALQPQKVIIQLLELLVVYITDNSMWIQAFILDVQYISCQIFL